MYAKEIFMGKYLTEKQRYQIEILLGEKYKVKDIAKIVNKSVRTIYYEIHRGKVEMLNSNLTTKIVYCADTAHAKYRENRKNKGQSYKIGHDYKLADFIETWIRDYKYSPYAVLQKIKNENLHFNTTICVKTLYNYIDNKLFLTISNKDLPVKKDKKKQKHNKIRRVALNNIKGTSIEERNKDILDRERYGDWEIDTVVGGQKKENLVYLFFQNG